ncbi:unnamed protein product [Caenorhabditis auriculariae]|uniref:Uncharacterized protein n=1 Tax=Caenorhabditis auriculariae TaxID=2777116 RepID=A0A8S1GS99_9PELO|nr:unnamed protein product [Caenorhabditis auriculariae]
MRSSKPIRHSCNSTEDGLQRYPDQGLDETNKNYANKNVSEQERNKSFSTPPYIICKSESDNHRKFF